MLELYKNIKSRRTELKMSQDTLAELTGYKDRSSIAKIEKGEVDLAESKIREFAKALNVSPQELMGWDEIENTIKKANEAVKDGKKVDNEKATEAFVKQVKTIAAHFDGDEYTEEELDEIKKFAEFVKAKRQ